MDRLTLLTRVVDWFRLRLSIDEQWWERCTVRGEGCWIPRRRWDGVSELALVVDLVIHFPGSDGFTKTGHVVY